MTEEEINALLSEYLSVTHELGEAAANTNPFALMVAVQMKMTEFLEKVYQMGRTAGIKEGVRKEKERCRIIKSN